MSLKCSLVLIFATLVCGVSSQKQTNTKELPNFTNQPFNVSVFRGESALLTCSVNRLGGNQAVAWMKLNPTSSFLTSGTQSFSSQEGKLVITSGETGGNLRYDLRINNVTEADAGEYICTVVEFGELNYRRWRRSQVATVTVIIPTPRPKLLCTADPHPEHLHVGVHFRIGCKLDGAGQSETQISMNWTRDGNMVVSRTKFEGIQFGTGRYFPELMHMFQVSMRDVGAVFECSVEYDHHNGTHWGTFRDSCIVPPLNVEPYSNLVLRKRSLATVDEGQEVRFHCPARGPQTLEPQFQAFTWNINPTISPARFRLSHHGDDLIIHRVIAEDNGLKVSCFVPPFSKATAKRELYLKVRSPDKSLLWEPREPAVVVPFGPELLTNSNDSANATSMPTTVSDSGNITTNPPTTVTPTADFKNSLTVDSSNDTNAVNHAGSSDATNVTVSDHQGYAADGNGTTTFEDGTTADNLTIAFKLIPPSSRNDAANVMTQMTSSSSSSSSGLDIDLDAPVMDGGDPFHNTPDVAPDYPKGYDYDHEYDLDPVSQNINRSLIAPNDLTSSDFIFIFVMIAEVLLTILLVVLLLVTGPVCFASKRNKDMEHTNDTDIEKSATPFPVMISPSTLERSIKPASEKVIPQKISSPSIDRRKLSNKEIPTVDITLSFEVKEKPNDVVIVKDSRSDVSTVSGSLTDEQGSDASTVEFKTFGYPRSDCDSSEA